MAEINEFQEHDDTHKKDHHEKPTITENLRNLMVQEKSAFCNKQDFNRLVGTILKATRLEKQKSQEYVCARLQIKQPQLSAYEAGIYSISNEMIYKFALALDINPAIFAFKIFNEFDLAVNEKGNSIKSYEELIDNAKKQKLQTKESVLN